MLGYLIEREGGSKIEDWHNHSTVSQCAQLMFGKWQMSQCTWSMALGASCGAGQAGEIPGHRSLDWKSGYFHLLLCGMEVLSNLCFRKTEILWDGGMKEVFAPVQNGAKMSSVTDGMKRKGQKGPYRNKTV